MGVWFFGFELEPATWSLLTWWLWIVGTLLLVWFVYYWILFHKHEPAAATGDEAAVVRFNKAISGFPAAIYAKMLGKRRYQRRQDESSK